MMGARREDYEAVAPTNSFIHVDDFESPQSLAEYLRRLDANDTLYNEYFRWKGTMELAPGAHTGQYWCRLCMLLHLRDDDRYVQWYDDYTNWWNGACYAQNADGRPWKTWRRSSGQKSTKFSNTSSLATANSSSTSMPTVNATSRQ